MNLKTVLAFLLPLGLQAQSTFVNLDFEATTVPVYLTAYPYGRLPVSQALPGWSVLENNVPVSAVCYNTCFNTILWANAYSPPQSLGGNFSVCFIPIDTLCSLSQVGTLPSDAKSLRFRTCGILDPEALSVSFAGNSLATVVMWSGANGYFQDFGADISALAGSTGELRFTYHGGNSCLDDITFSPNPVPEPGVWVLLGLGALALGHRRLCRVERLARDLESNPNVPNPERPRQTLP